LEVKTIHRYVVEAQVRNFTQLFPNYLHVRFSDTTLVSQSNTPKDDVFERKDNYYVHLKPFDVADEAVSPSGRNLPANRQCGFRCRPIERCFYYH